VELNRKGLTMKTLELNLNLTQDQVKEVYGLPDDPTVSEWGFRHGDIPVGTYAAWGPMIGTGKPDWIKAERDNLKGLYAYAKTRKPTKVKVWGLLVATGLDYHYISFPVSVRVAETWGTWFEAPRIGVTETTTFNNPRWIQVEVDQVAPPMPTGDKYAGICE
jgi:hypothetical protein